MAESSMATASPRDGGETKKALTAEKRRFRWIFNDPDGGEPSRVMVARHNGEEGFWTAWTMECSGCYEVGDYGAGSHLYGYDRKAGCGIGGGCDECGYTGKRRIHYFIPFAGYRSYPTRRAALAALSSPSGAVVPSEEG